MPSLGDAFDEAKGAWERRRLYFGTALLFVGAVIAAPGLASVLADGFAAAGFAESRAITLGIGVAALAVPFAGAALLRMVPADRQFRTAGAAGVVLSTIAVAAFVAGGPIEGPASLGSVPLAVGATYVVGALLALVSPALAAGLAGDDSSRTRPSTAFVRETRSVRPGGQVPADGGEEDEELAFLLDRDDE